MKSNYRNTDEISKRSKRKKIETILAKYLFLYKSHQLYIYVEVVPKGPTHRSFYRNKYQNRSWHMKSGNYRAGAEKWVLDVPVPVPVFPCSRTIEYWIRRAYFVNVRFYELWEFRVVLVQQQIVRLFVRKKQVMFRYRKQILVLSYSNY